ncbi:DUF4189 domain-containing protein [Stenotrophomonas indicatrix]|uniref:DUF4189 domain-containing protein n=1 Tax=Stenotrophomonas indicatrix TaxID=2045451 RepID=UPI003D165382
MEVPLNTASRREAARKKAVRDQYGLAYLGSIEVRQVIGVVVFLGLLAAGNAGAQEAMSRAAQGVGLSPNGPPPQSGPRPRYPWGSIATGKNDVSGWSFDARSEDEADRLAIQSCEQAGGIDCKARASVAGRCAVVVHGPDRFTMEVSLNTASRREAAKDRALKRCGEQCWVVKEICSVRD